VLKNIEKDLELVKIDIPIRSSIITFLEVLKDSIFCEVFAVGKVELEA
jgi:hypothetical protein